MLLTGISLLIYPSFSNWWNNFNQAHTVASYTERVSHIDDNEYERILGEAHKYNESIAETGIRWELTEQEKEQYNSQLDISGIGIMGYIEIPRINVVLPVYHGTEDSVLETAIGHLEGTSLPVGGEGSHCVLSGHRGLPSARLFTDLDKLTSGDTFMLNILDEVLTYEVDRIRIVLPSDLSDLTIEDGKDYCTLVTCTPYGINTHRLLVRGKRIESRSTLNIRVTADAMMVDRVLVAIAFGVPTLLIIILVWLVVTGLQRRNNRLYRDITR
jgi:sortase A